MRSIKRAFLRVNEAIRAREVRLISAEGKQVGIVPIEQARKMAEEAALDLVEVAPDATPPVCKVIDYRKVLYEQKRREREGRKHRRHVEIKEVKMRPTIDQHDYETKLRHVREFLEEGHKVKVTMMYRGREMGRTEAGRARLMRIVEDLAGIAAPEDRMVQIGRQQRTDPGAAGAAETGGDGGPQAGRGARAAGPADAGGGIGAAVLAEEEESHAKVEDQSKRRQAVQGVQDGQDHAAQGVP